MAKTRRAYSGNATSTTLASGISAGDTTITISAATGWPSGAPFYVVIDPGTASEEKVLVTRSSTTLTVSGSRGADDTSAASHSAGAVIYPVFTAVDANEANELTAKYATQGSIVHQGASTFTELAIGTAAHVLKVNSGATAPEWGQVATAGIADGAVTEAKLASNAVTTGKIAAGAVETADLADGAVTEAKLGTGAVTADKIGSSAVTTDKIANSAITSIKIADGTILANDLANGAVTEAKIGTGAVTETKIGTGAVTSDKILDGTIVNADINASAAIALSKLATGALPTGITVESANIVNGTILNVDINTTAGIAPTKFAPFAISRTRTTNASISNNSWTDVAFATSNYNIGSAFTYTSGTGVISVPTGLVFVRASLRFTADATGSRGIRILDGGDVVMAQMNVAAAPNGASVVSCSFLSYNALGSPSYRVQAYQTSGGSLNVEGEPSTNFEAFCIGGA